MGLSLSLAVELFLRHVTETGKLPFTLGEAFDEEAEEERELWKAFTVWYLKVWPRFVSKEDEERAFVEYDYSCDNAGAKAERCIVGGMGGDPCMMTPEQREAWLDLGKLTSLANEAKELIHWALAAMPLSGMELTPCVIPRSRRCSHSLGSGGKDGL